MVVARAVAAAGVTHSSVSSGRVITSFKFKSNLASSLMFPWRDREAVRKTFLVSSGCESECGYARCEGWEEMPFCTYVPSFEARSVRTRYSEAMDVLSLFLGEMARDNDTPSSCPCPCLVV